LAPALVELMIELTDSQDIIDPADPADPADPTLKREPTEATDPTLYTEPVEPILNTEPQGQWTRPRALRTYRKS